MPYPITTQRALRQTFWQLRPDLSRRRIRNYRGDGLMHTTDTRCAWCGFVDAMARDNQISMDLAQRATL